MENKYTYKIILLQFMNVIIYGTQSQIYSKESKVLSNRWNKYRKDEDFKSKSITVLKIELVEDIKY